MRGRRIGTFLPASDFAEFVALWPRVEQLALANTRPVEIRPQEETIEDIIAETAKRRRESELASIPARPRRKSRDPEPHLMPLPPKRDTLSRDDPAQKVTGAVLPSYQLPVTPLERLLARDRVTDQCAAGLRASP